MKSLSKDQLLWNRIIIKRWKITLSHNPAPKHLGSCMEQTGICAQCKLQSPCMTVHTHVWNMDAGAKKLQILKHGSFIIHHICNDSKLFQVLAIPAQTRKEISLHLVWNHRQTRIRNKADTGLTTLYHSAAHVTAVIHASGLTPSHQDFTLVLRSCSLYLLAQCKYLSAASCLLLSSTLLIVYKNIFSALSMLHTSLIMAFGH